MWTCGGLNKEKDPFEEAYVRSTAYKVIKKVQGVFPLRSCEEVNVKQIGDGVV